jgi:GT2 family glycosyltransferase
MISVIIPAHNEGGNLADTVSAALENAGCDAVEVVVVDDGSTDGSPGLVADRFPGSHQVRILREEGLGVARARNRGAQAASGEILVFMDGHCYTPPGWLSGLAVPLAEPQVGLVGPAFASLLQGNGPRGFGAVWADASLEIQWLPQLAGQPYWVPLLPGGCHAIRREVFDRLGGYDEGMTRWGAEDHELCMRAWLLGYQVVFQPAVTIYHLFRTHHPYAVETAKIVHNRLRLALLHFRRERVLKVMAHYQNWSSFPEAVMALLESDVMVRREQLWQQRVRDDDWYFAQFGDTLG